jgi:hypothetical protein
MDALPDDDTAKLAEWVLTLKGAGTVLFAPKNTLATVGRAGR